MSSGAWVFLGLVWASVAALVALLMVQRAPKRRKPVDELEATDAALRNRIVDLEDKFEAYTKRENVRQSRARIESEGAGVGRLPIKPAVGGDRSSYLAALRMRARERGLIRGPV